MEGGARYRRRGGIGRAVVARLCAEGIDVLAVDLVVPNAGRQHVAPVDEFPADRFREMVALMLISPFVLAKHAWSALRKSGAGRFIAVASVHRLVASPFKAALLLGSWAG
jgi:3-hydroxybutyrate dehydrogenase